MESRNSTTLSEILKWSINLLGPVLFLLSLTYSPFESIDARTHSVIALGVWMLIWWISEFAPLAVTSLLPIVILPSFGIMSESAVVTPYSSSVIFLFLGGFIIALGMEKCNLHRRIALTILKMMGSRADLIVLGFMIASAFLSMWISNTATAVMMLPIILSVVNMIEQNVSTATVKNLHNMKMSMLIGMAYACNVGGMGTLIGTPPNAIFAGYMSETYGVSIGFLQWMVFAIPIVIVLLAAIYLLLTKVYYPSRLGRIDGFNKMLVNEINTLGEISPEERRTFVLFLSAALLWVGRDGVNYLLGTSIQDASVAIFIAALFFIIPKRRGDSKRLLDWKDTSQLPWGVLLLFGGGLSLASALSSTGVLTTFGNFISESKDMSFTLIVIVLMSIMVVFTEFMSNTALATIFLPIIAGIGVAMGVDPVIFAAPMVLAASCVFSLPMGTPPNAVIFASGEIKIDNMIRVGVVMDPLSVILLILVGHVIANMVF